MKAFFVFDVIVADSGFKMVPDNCSEVCWCDWLSPRSKCRCSFPVCILHPPLQDRPLGHRCLRLTNKSHLLQSCELIGELLLTSPYFSNKSFSSILLLHFARIVLFLLFSSEHTPYFSDYSLPSYLFIITNHFMTDPICQHLTINSIVLLSLLYNSYYSFSYLI